MTTKIHKADPPVGRTTHRGTYIPRYGNPVEHAIVRALITHMRARGFISVCVWDSEQYVSAGNIPNAMDAIFEVDADVTLHFAPIDKPGDWGSLGVLLIQGNGWDMISDYHCGNKDFDAAMEAFSNLTDEDNRVLALEV